MNTVRILGNRKLYHDATAANNSDKTLELYCSNREISKK